MAALAVDWQMTMGVCCPTTVDQRDATSSSMVDGGQRTSCTRATSALSQARGDLMYQACISATTRSCSASARSRKTSSRRRM